jgi:hypothetical protein
MKDTYNHLVIIQGVINRMGSNSFLLKGWTVTLVGGLMAVAATTGNGKVALLGYFPVVIFWGLDAYYLWHERLFIALYKDVAKGSKKIAPYSLVVNSYKKDKKWLDAMVSKTVCPLYVVCALVIIVVALTAGKING